MLQLHNKTPFAADILLAPDEQGIDTCYIIVKASFNIGQQWTLLDPQPAVCKTDEYWAEPGESSLKYASDMHLGKVATDIVMLGHACAPNNQAVKQLDVTLQVGEIHKTVRVFGDRVWQDGRISPPQPFVSMPLIYEKAYGGQHWHNDEILSVDNRNPLGCGYAGTREQADMHGQALPNLENPAELIQHYSDQPTPACFAYMAPSSQSRLQYAGSYDTQWQQHRAPFLPADFDKRFFNMVSADLIYPGFLQGGEHVSLTHIHPNGHLQFTLPDIKLVTTVDINNKPLSPPLQIETLLLEPNQLRLSMVWRASIPCDKNVLKIKRISVNLSR